MTSRTNKTEKFKSREALPAKVPPVVTQGQFSFDELDRVMHEKARLGILASLVANPEGLSFNQLKTLCDLTDGNLSRHLQVLTESQMVGCRKSGQGRNTLSQYKLTSQGIKAFQTYLDALHSVVVQTQQAALQRSLPTRSQSTSLRPATG